MTQQPLMFTSISDMRAQLELTRGRVARWWGVSESTLMGWEERVRISDPVRILLAMDANSPPPAAAPHMQEVLRMIACLSPVAKVSMMQDSIDARLATLKGIVSLLPDNTG